MLQFISQTWIVLVQSLLLLLSLLSLVFQVSSYSLPNSSSSTSSTSQHHQIKICQNKQCIKQFSSNYDGNLIQMFHDLLPPSPTTTTTTTITNVDDEPTTIQSKVTIESSGCLSNCGKGPNVCIITHNNNKEKGGMFGMGSIDNIDNNERMFNNVGDLQTVAAVLEVGTGIDCPIELMVAVDGMIQVSRTCNDTEKIKILNKIISSLEMSAFSTSKAMSHALLLRADAYLNANDMNPNKALEDATKAASIDHLHGRAYRIKADAYEALGDVLKAMEAVEQWAGVNPLFMSKAKNELSRLLQIRNTR